MATTVHALRNCMTPSSWAKYAQHHGIVEPRVSDDDKVMTDTDDLKNYEVTPELQQLMADAEKLDEQFKAFGITLDI